VTAHLLIFYPTPKNRVEFDREYRDKHLPFARPKFLGATGVATTRAFGPGVPPYHLISDVTFPGLAELLVCALSTEGRQALAHGASISTGGAPLIIATVDDSNEGIQP